jgi:hypothetical protein
MEIKGKTEELKKKRWPTGTYGTQQRPSWKESL